MYMAMIMRLLIGWALTYGLSVLLAVGYDMLTDVDDFFLANACVFGDV